MKFSAARAACLMGIATLLVQQGFALYWGETGAPSIATSLLFPLFWLIFLLFHIVVLRLSEVREQLFITWYMGLLGLKVFLAMIAVLFYGYFHPEGLFSFVSVFLPLYGVLTAIQVAETVSFLRKKEGKKKEEEG